MKSGDSPVSPVSLVGLVGLVVGLVALEALRLYVNKELLFANHPRFTRGCGPRAFVWCVCIWRRLALWTARISCEPKIQMSRGALGRSAATVRGGGAASPVHSVVT